MKRKIILFLVFTFALAPYALLFQSKYYYFNSIAQLKDSERSELIHLAAEALKTKDVPVASIVIYNGKIIGKGFNTVLRDNHIGGHAEVNAISDVIKNIGTKKFNELNRDSLKLITTFEPCLMCKGAIIENRIKYVEFLKEKDFTHWLKNDFKSLNYEIKKCAVNEPTLQDSLFFLHPDYTK